ncbi:hypothetical protein [Rhodococcus sp. ACS1]|uniref:Rv1733c family protein n=1 Tax=Rhodococcus sp. ACS1 TaxID=2028570 RepID=UPI0026CDD3EC|nr:hypothetical protein [Rhodococcus sp. ACS1]
MLILLTIPFAAAFGTATHIRLEHQALALRAGVQQVPAVLLDDTHPAPDTPEDALRPTGTKDSARARRSTPHGEHTAVVPIDTPAKAGQTITISIGADGKLTGPIPSSRQNTALAATAATAACGVWALSAGALLVPTTLTRKLLHRKRLRQCAYEWKQLDTPPG